MKKIVLFLLCSGLLISCNKEDDGPDEKIVLQQVTISNSEIFEYSLGNFGDEESAYITTHPKNSEISLIIRDEVPGEIIIQYKANENFQGSDYVEIFAGRGSSNGTTPSTNIEIHKITFTVTD